MILTTWYEVRYLALKEDGFIDNGCKSFSEKDKAEEFFNELSDVVTKLLVLCETEVSKKVLLSTL